MLMSRAARSQSIFITEMGSTLPQRGQSSIKLINSHHYFTSNKQIQEFAIYINNFKLFIIVEVVQSSTLSKCLLIWSKFFTRILVKWRQFIEGKQFIIAVIEFRACQI